MEEDIKILENLIKDFERIEKFNVEEKEIFSPYNKFVEIIKSIKNLIARNKELIGLLNGVEIFRENNFSEETNYVIALKSSCMSYLKTNYIPKSKIKEILYPTPENPIDLEIQNSKMYKKLLKLIGE